MATNEHEPKGIGTISSRREFLKFLAVAPPIAAYEFMMANRIMQEPYDIDPSTLAMIQERSQEVTQHITVSGFDAPVYYREKKKFKVQPDAQAMAQAILLLAYRDGGIERTQQVEKTIQERGLSIAKSDSTFLASFGTGKPMRVNFSPSLFGTLYLSEQSTDSFPYTDYIVFHEFYHLVQSASLTPEEFNDSIRDDQYLALAVSGFLTFLDGLEEALSLEQQVHEGKPIDREAVLSYGLRAGGKIALKTVVKAVVAYFVAKSLLIPIEQEASLRGSGFYSRLPGLLTMHPIFDSVRGKLFSFEEIKA